MIHLALLVAATLFLGWVAMRTVRLVVHEIAFLTGDYRWPVRRSLYSYYSQQLGERAARKQYRVVPDDSPEIDY